MFRKNLFIFSLFALNALFGGCSTDLKNSALNEVNTNSEDTLSMDNYECHEELTMFGEVEIYGSFASDLGCVFSEMVINGKKFTYTEGTAHLMKGLVKAKDSTKIIALIDRVYLQHEKIIEHETGVFEEYEVSYTYPYLAETATGYKLEAWILIPAQMIPEEHYELCEFTISKAGIISQKSMNRFTRSF